MRDIDPKCSLAKGSEGVSVHQNLDGAEQDHDVAHQAPSIHIFKIGFHPLQNIRPGFRGAPGTADLRKTRYSGFQRMPFPILAVDEPEQYVLRRRSAGMRSWRSAERRGGKECVSTCRCRWSTYP